ncbi:MAG: hypothetical protein JW913_04490 [Chitinispirillaceae bacterium]|nr:hypothetical protein [Chitinispirillaceae bacterium]
MKLRIFSSTALILLSTVPTAHALEFRGTCDLPGFAYDVAIEGNHAYVSTDSGLCVVDISQPEAPALNGYVPLAGYGNELALYGACAFVTDGSARAFQVVDITDPAHPASIGGFGDSCGYVWGIHCGDSAEGRPALCAVGATRGMILFDITDPHHPVKAGEYVPYDDKPSSFFTDVPFDEFDEKNESARDTSLRYYPFETCVPPLFDERTYMVKTDDVHLEGTVAYVLYYDNGNCGTGLYLKTVDIADPENPSCIDSIGLYAWGCGFAVASQKVYVAHIFGFDLIEGGIETPLRTMGNIRLPGNKEDVALAGDCAYVTWHPVGLFGISISDPQNMKWVDTTSIPGGGRGCAAGGEHLFVACGDSGFSAYSIPPSGTRARATVRPAPEKALRASVAGGTVTFIITEAIPLPAAIHVYDLQGHAATTITAGQRTVIWNRRTAAGNRIAPGMYLAAVAAGARLTESTVLMLH